MRRARALVLVSLAALGCGARSGLEVHASPDASRPVDAGIDAPIDVGVDAPIDAGVDAAIGCRIAWDDTVRGELHVTADDNFSLFVQGTLVDETPRDWHEVQTYAIRIFRHPQRRNTIAIDGLNVFRIDGLDRAVIADLRADIEGPRTLVTDASWRVSTTFPDDWFAVDFDASGWAMATVEGRHGILPYGALISGSTASWLWSYDSAMPASAKPERERVLFRRDFYVDLTGVLRDTPGECP